MSTDKNELSVLLTFEEKSKNYLLYDVSVEYSNDFTLVFNGVNLSKLCEKKEAFERRLSRCGVLLTLVAKLLLNFWAKKRVTLGKSSAVARANLVSGH